MILYKLKTLLETGELWPRRGDSHLPPAMPAHGARGWHAALDLLAQAPGLKVEQPTAGCCGMAGT